MDGYLLLVAAIAAIAVGTLLIYWRLHLRAERARWSRYTPTAASVESKPVVCPHCRQRCYSPRANREHFCPNCERHY